MNKYRISVNYTDYFKLYNKIKSFNVTTQGEAVSFDTDKPSLDYIESQNIVYMKLKDKPKSVKQHIRIYRFAILGVIIMAFIIYINTFRVSDVSFNGDYPINDEIKEDIRQTYKPILFWNFSNVDYTSFSRKLRAKYYQYEWINVYKKQTKLHIDIYPTSAYPHPDEDLRPGNIVATKEGVVKSFLAFNGKPLITVNQFVKLGDILISGNMLANTDRTEEVLTNAKGYALGYTYQEDSITVNKIDKREELTGKQSSHLALNSWNWGGSSFNRSERKEEVFFTIPYLLAFKKVHEYEKSDIIYTYDKADAITYAQNLIRARFLENKTLKDEYISRLEVLTVVETDDAYTITCLVKKYESLGVFEPYEQTKISNK